MQTVNQLRSIEDVMDVLSEDNLSDFLALVRACPMISDEENNLLLADAKNGDRDAINALLLGNLVPIVTISKRQHPRGQSYQLLDTIHEGVIGFLKSIEGYDLNDNSASFRTYMTTCVKNAIIDAHGQNNAVIRKPQSVTKGLGKFERLMKEYESTGREIPNDDELCVILNMTPFILESVKKDYLYNCESLNAKVSDTDEREKSELIGQETCQYDPLLSAISDKELMLYLKSILPAYQYYVLFNRVLSIEEKLCSELGEAIGTTGNAIEIVGKKVRRFLETVVNSDGEFEYSFSDKDAEIMSVEPENPLDIMKFFFFRDSLEKDERQLYRLITSSKYVNDVNAYAKVLGWDKTYCLEILGRVEEKTRLDNSKIQEVFESFKKTFLEKYGPKLFKLDTDEPLNDVITNAKYIAIMWGGISYEEASRIFEAQNVKISNSMENLVSRYFGRNEDNSVYKDYRVAEREVNVVLSGFKGSNDLPLNKLIEVLINNRKQFTEEEYTYLLAYKFKRISSREFMSRYPDSNISSSKAAFLSKKLDALYFGITDYREYNFTREKYEGIRERSLEKLSSEQVELLDMFYGVGCDKHSIKEIAAEKSITYDDAKHKLANAKTAAVGVYLEKSCTKTFDAEHYIPYILNIDVDINPVYREMMREFIIKGKSYEEIAAIHGVTKDKVSTNILNGMYKIDLYRFGILQKNKYTQEEISSVLYSDLFSEVDRAIVLASLEGMPQSEICTKHKTTATKINSLMTKLKQNCFKRKVAEVEISKADIAREVNAHPSQMVLNTKERLMLACIYGIKCDLNSDGKIYSIDEIKRAYPELKSKFNQILENASYTVAGRKMGLVRATYDYMDRRHLQKSLSDFLVPISDKERELLYYAYELNGYPYKSVPELAAMYGESISRVGKRIQKAFVTIFKYENCEIEPNISPKEDVLPYLRFFSKADQKVLVDKYFNKMSLRKIADQNGLSKSQVGSLLLRLDNHLKDLINGKANGFDFNYFYLCVGKDDVPFYGDKTMAMRIFHLYYEKRMSASDIIEVLKLDCSEGVIMDIISSLKTAVLKRKEGVVKARVFSLEEVTKYYLANKDNMGGDRLKAYKRYFLRYKNEDSNSVKNITQSDINATIVCDLMKENGELPFDMKTASREDALEILRKYRNDLSDRTIATLQKIYNIDSIEFMRGSDQMKVLRFLSSLDVSHKILSMKKSA